MDLYSSKTYVRYRKLFLLCFGCQSLFQQIMVANGLFMTSYAFFIGASDAQIGMLAAIPGLANIFQIFSYILYIKAKSRKKVLCILYILEYFFLYFMIVIPKIVSGSYQIYFLILFYFFGYLSEALIGGGFIEWNSFYVPENRKGRYFSNRNLISNIIYIIISLTVGKILDHYDGVYTAYVAILFITLMFSVTQIVLILNIQDCSEDLGGKPTFNLLNMLRIPLRDKKYISYVKFAIWWNFSVLLASPYYTIYSIKYVGLAYSFIAVVGSITCFLKVLVARVWGSTGDKKGWKKVVVFAGSGYAFTNMLWFFVNSSTAFLYPIIIILNGVCMIGINICIFNLNFDLSSKQDRLIYFGFNASVVGIFSFISPNVSALIVKLLGNYHFELPFLEINPYQIVFLIAAISQLSAICYLIRKIYGNKNIKVKGQDNSKSCSI